MAGAWGNSWGAHWGNSWGSSAPPVVRVVDGGEGITEKHVRELQRAVAKERSDQEKTYAQRKRDQADLRKALETAWDGVKEETPEVFTEAAPEVDFERKKVNWAPLIRDHDAILRIVMDLETKLAAQQEAQRQIVIKAAILAEQQRQFEDDEAVALIFLAA